jgi:hypothetical protein
MAPRSWNLPEPGQPNEEVDAMTIAHDAHPPAEDQDQHDQDQAPHVCHSGWVTLGQIAIDSETGEETEEYALYLCRRCAEEGEERF